MSAAASRSIDELSSSSSAAAAGRLCAADDDDEYLDFLQPQQSAPAHDA